MNKVIYIDFDGVLVDTPKFISKELKIKGNSEETCKNFPWDYFLKNCNEIENNLTVLKKISQQNKVVILTHVYSDKEKSAKENFVYRKLKNIQIISVPYYIDKNIIVNPKDNILIDDYSNNIEKWINSSGIGIHLKNEKRIDKLLIDYIVI